MNVLELVAQAESLQQRTDAPELLIKLYDEWLEEHGSEREAAPAWFNYGVHLSACAQTQEASNAYKRALALKPDFWQAAANLSGLLEAVGDMASAVAVYERVLAWNIEQSGKTHVLNHLGRLYEVQRQFRRAADFYAQSLALNPEQEDAFQHWFYLRQKMCDWPLEKFPKPLTVSDLAQKMGPLSAMAYFDDPELIAKSASAWAKRLRNRGSFRPLCNGDRYTHDRLRIGYLSADFRAHAVCFLMAEVFGLHDRSRFEVFGLDYSKDDGSAWRQKVINGFDHHVQLHQLTDEQAAQLIKSLEIDILVDLSGLTAGARPGILMHKPAPVQASYLGFLGPPGIKEIDYLICDHYTVAPEHEWAYGAKLLRLPFYQVNNRLRVAAPTPTRKSQGLPENAFVYCALNNSYKITAAVFARWMEILRRTEKSVLWLLEENPEVSVNLMREAVRHGIDPGRLVFAQHAQPADYLARFQCGDLFLDTSPYNAGITATDALVMGLPVLTCPGNSFVSRMAADLLLACGLDSFVCCDWNQYVEKAVEFAKTRQAKFLLANQQAKISAVLETSHYVSELETLYKKIATETAG
jgi:predicted O-linked N-acetylglucosamine transferase (SPINDLY family)